MTFWSIVAELGEGFLVSCEIFFITLIIALPLGLAISFGSMARWKPVRAVIKTIVWIVRGTPLMLQIMIIYYAPGLLFNVRGINNFPAVIIAFGINYACYFSEIYRGGIESISKGQYEAGQVLGMTRSQIFFKVILLQVVKRIVPPMSNEVITLVKDTSLARIIVVEEILKIAYDYTVNGLIWPLFYTAVYYLIFVGILTLLFGFLEKKLNYFKV